MRPRDMKPNRSYGAYQAMGRGGFGLGRQGDVGREYGGCCSKAPITKYALHSKEPPRLYGDVGPGGEGGVQTVPWPWEVAARRRWAEESKRPNTKYRLHSKSPIR